MRAFRNLLRPIAAVLLGTALASNGCSGPTASSTAAKGVPAKPQVVALTLEGQAERINRGPIHVTLTDTSGDGAKVVDVSTIELDKLTTKDGQTVPARLRSFDWSKKAATAGAPEVFALELMIDSRFAEPEATLEGAFRTYAGTVTPVAFPVKDIPSGQINDAKLQALSITAKLTESTKVEFEVEGTDLAQMADVELVDGSKVVKQVARGMSSTGSKSVSSRRYWHWVSDSELPKDCQLKVWLQSDNRQGEPSWTLKPLQTPDNKVRHDSLSLAGEIRTQRSLNAQINGPAHKLLTAKFVDGDTTPEQSEPRVDISYQRSLFLSLKAPTPSTALQISILEDGYENMQVFRIENLAIQKQR